MPSWAAKTARPPVAASTMPIDVDGVRVERVDRVQRVLQDQDQGHHAHGHPADEKDPAQPVDGPAPAAKPDQAGPARADSWIATRTTKVSTAKPISIQIASVAIGR